MILLKNLLNMICTEAFEHIGIPEVPNTDLLRTTLLTRRCDITYVARVASSEQALLRYDLELIEREDGTLEWVE